MNQANEERVHRIQSLLRETGIPAWLFYDFRGSDPIAYRVLGLDPAAHTTRRWFYLVPAEGTPVKLVHRIESGRLDALPGERRVYLEWSALHAALREILAPFPAVLMQYSPQAAIPYVSRVDAGTVELVRSCGSEVRSSGDLLQHLECILTPEQLAGHRSAARVLHELVLGAFRYIQDALRSGRPVTEQTVQERLHQGLAAAGLVTDFPPIVAVGPHAGNPHYSPAPGGSDAVSANNLVLIDIWAKQPAAGSIFADITWTAWFGATPPDRVREIFRVVAAARDRGVAFLRERFAAGEPVQGWEVDDAVRGVIREAGYGRDFIHRTGHNLGEDVHGNGVHFDNLETHDDRRVIPGIACTIEPGIYLPDFGIRSEIDVYFGACQVEVTTAIQDELLCFPA
ncbi:MAG: M24 family metallopeptidase [Acidobacteriota bacterium]